MTTSITAVFERGLLRPTVPLDLAEGAEVRIVVLPANGWVAEPPTPRRALGTLKGTVRHMAADFDAPLDEFRDAVG